MSETRPGIHHRVSTREGAPPLLTIEQLADKTRDRARSTGRSIPEAAGIIVAESKGSVAALGFDIEAEGDERRRAEIDRAIRAISEELGRRGGMARAGKKRRAAHRKTQQQEAVYRHHLPEARRGGFDSVDEMEEALRE